jgi:hypothetical protein
MILSKAAVGQQECVKIADNDKRLDCYDRVLNYMAPITPAEEQPKPVPWIRFAVRDRGDFNNFAGADLGTKSGQFNLQRSEGRDSSNIRLGAIASFRAVNDLGWQPFAALAWNRDTGARTPIDARDFTAGITGPLWDPYGVGWTMHATLRATRRVDVLGTGDGSTLGLNFNVVKLSWVDSVPSATKNSYQFVPHFGLLGQARRSGAGDDGNWRSAYAGLTLSAQLNRIMPRLSASATYRRFNDQTTPAGNARRHEPYGSLSFEYALTDPNNNQITIRPALTLTRETGTDLLYGGAALNRTMVGFSLKVN